MYLGINGAVGTAFALLPRRSSSGVFTGVVQGSGPPPEEKRPIHITAVYSIVSLYKLLNYDPPRKFLKIRHCIIHKEWVIHTRLKKYRCSQFSAVGELRPDLSFPVLETGEFRPDNILGIVTHIFSLTRKFKMIFLKTIFHRTLCSPRIFGHSLLLASTVPQTAVKFYTSHPNIYNFVDVLLQIQSETYIKFRKQKKICEKESFIREQMIKHERKEIVLRYFLVFSSLYTCIKLKNIEIKMN
ncbi:MULE domain-containing protein [Aphis craccivora]|uniref:MULE domain-containing protein n=1 Tax=Aphis craccivora TaxID=307492 RepID=A0A6G0Z9K5_APHCR|nr:MULE domain-containing protein [Aphis craccivora]